jgi:hypothetical protein
VTDRQTHEVLRAVSVGNDDGARAFSLAEPPANESHGR